MEKIMAAKRRERDEREQRERDHQRQLQRGSGSISPTDTGSKAQKSMKASTDPTPKRKIVSPKGGKTPVVPSREPTSTWCLHCWS
jgi:hypothetical protein